MAYLTEAQVRAAAAESYSHRVLRKSFAQIIKEEAAASTAKSFDIFLSHSIKDEEIVYGAKRILENRGKTVYVDWMVDPQLDRTEVTAATAEKLRSRMTQCKSLLYLYSRHSQCSRWMPWELGYFDGHNGNVAVLPVVPNAGELSFSKEEYLQLYPKVDFGEHSIWVNKSTAVFKTMNDWMTSADKLRPSA